jgi:hypothetical protein
VDSSQANPSLPSSAAVRPSVRDKFRLRFRKGGTLRLLSHHDLMRCFERLLRRSGLPYHRTQGFHPHPRLVFALSLPLGVVGLEEVAELELDEVLSPEEVHERLRRQTPEGLDILSVQRIGLKTTAQVRSFTYRLTVPASRVDAARVRELLAAPEIWQTRGEKHHANPSPPAPLSASGWGEPEPLPPPPPLRGGGPGGRGSQARVNLRPFLRDLRVQVSGEQAVLEIDLWLTPAGTAKPAEVLGLLGLRDLLDAGTVLERSRLELHDECGAPGAPGRIDDTQVIACPK